MKIEKRLIPFNIAVYIIFLFLPLNKIVVNATSKQYYNWIFLGIVVSILIVIIIIYNKMSNKLMPITQRQININKYTLYAYIPFYIVYAMSARDDNKMKIYILSSILILIGLFGIIYNTYLLIKNKD